MSRQQLYDTLGRRPFSDRRAQIICLLLLLLTADLAISATAAGASGTCDEMIINARRRPEAAQDVPVAVTGIDAQQIERSSWLDLVDVQRRTPGLQATHAASGSGRGGHFFVRGIGQVDFITTTEPGVGLYLDGVYLGRVSGAALDLTDIDSIEVIRGPQGAIWGKNNIGGAIVVATAPPGPDNERALSLRVGNLNRYEIGGLFNQAVLPDRLAVRGAVKLIRSDGYSTRRVDGVDVGSNEDLVGRFQLRFRASDTLSLTGAVDGLRRNAHVSANSMVGFSATDLSTQYRALAGPIDGRYLQLEPGITDSAVRPSDELGQWGTALTIDWRPGAWQVRSVTAYRTMNQDTAGDFDGTPLPFLEQEIAIDQHQVTEEIQVSWDLLDGRLQLMLGTFLMDEDVQWNQFGDFARGLYPLTGTDLTVNQFWDIDTTTAAAFANLSLDLTDRVAIFGGFRWTEERKDFTTRHRHLESGEVFIPYTDLESDLSEPSYSAGVRYRWNDALMTYVSTGSGFRSGGFNGRPLAPDELLPYGPEFSDSYEMGLKATLFDARLQLNTAVFWNEYDDIQLTGVAANDSGGLRIFVANVASARLAGGELEMAWNATDHWTLTAAVAHLTNRFTGIGAEATITKQDKLPLAPEWTGYLEGVFDVPLASGDLSLGVSGYFTTKQYHLIPNSDLERENGYVLIDARASFAPRDAAWTASFYATNLFDEVYRTFGQDSTASFGVAAGWYGRPREYGVDLRWRW